MRVAQSIQIALLVSWPVVALGQPAASPPERAPNPLQGPRVAEPAAKSTLVERDMAGKLRRLEVPPEEAALSLMALDAVAAAKTRTIIQERTVILDRIVLNNLNLVMQFHNARLAGDKRDQLVLLTQLLVVLKPLTDRGTLSEEIIGALSLDQSVTFKSLVRDYNQAAAAETEAESRAAGERLTQRQITARENLVVLGTEIKRSYERQITSRTAEFEQIMSQLELEPEQESKIRAMVLDYAQAVVGKPTLDQRRSLFFRMMAVLNADQQRTLIRLFVGRGD